MKLRHCCLACLPLLLAAALPARAEGLASFASSVGSTSMGSLSDSVQGSSQSSSRTTTVAEGDYRIVDVVAAVDRPGVMRLRLQATDRPGEAGELVLTLPQRALAPAGLAVGEVVHARHRPYGVEFARGDSREPFFLVLADDWRDALDPHAVTL